MVARILSRDTNAPMLICGPGWTSRCGAAGQDPEHVFCAGHAALIERATPEGMRVLRIAVPADQRTCPFAPAPTPAA